MPTIRKIIHKRAVVPEQCECRGYWRQTTANINDGAVNISGIDNQLDMEGIPVDVHLH